MSESKEIDKSFISIVSIVVTLIIAVLTGGIAWGVNSTKIDQNTAVSANIKETFNLRLDRIELRKKVRDNHVDKRFDKLDTKLRTILRAIIRNK